MKTFLFLAGLVLILGTLIAYNYLFALGCAMNTTGCQGYKIDWFNPDTAIVVYPPIAVGLVLIIFAVMRK